MTFYIGKEPTIGNYAKMDSISAVNGQATYNLLKGGVAFAPQSANHVICSLNSIIQNPGSSFTISGSQITFASNLQTGDSIDFILILGDVLSIGTPSDDTIDSAKLKTNSVIEAKIQDDAVTRDKINAISTSSLPSFEAKGDGSSVEGKIKLNCHVNSHGVTLQSPPHSSGQSWTLKLPDNSPTADKFMKVKSITGSGSTAVGQLEFADAGGGKVLQVVNATDSTQRTTTSTSFVTASNTLTANITPSATSSKILILVNTTCYNSASGYTYYTIYRDSTNVASNSSTNELTAVYGDGGTSIVPLSIKFLDSPNTTSQITYQVYMKVQNSTGYLNVNGNTGSIILIEIGA